MTQYKKKLSYLVDVLQDADIQIYNPSGKRVGIINYFDSGELTITFNSIDEINITVPKTVDGKTLECYKLLTMNRQLQIDNVDRFIITEINTEGTGENEIKNITAQSIDAILGWKTIPLLNSTYKFYSDNLEEQPNTLIGILKGYMPSWTFEDIDDDLYTDPPRTFNRENISIYNLIIQDIQPTYECVFLFDTINKSIKIKKLENLIPSTDVYINDENIIKEINCTLAKESFANVLEVKGSGELGINRVNPIGTNFIYNLDYYLNDNTGMMSEGLKNTWRIWKEVYNTYSPIYGTKLVALKTKKDELLTLQNQLAVLNGELEVILDSIDTKNKRNQNASTEVAQRNAKQIEINNKKAEITTKENEILALENELNSINVAINPQNNTTYFTSSQLEELDNIYTYGSVVSDLFAINNVMTEKEKQEEAERLLKFGQSKLANSSKYKQTFNLKTLNILANEKYQYMYNQLELPCKVIIEKSEDELYEPILLGCKINLKDISDIELTFSESLRASSDLVNITDLLGSPIDTQMKVIKNMAEWCDYVKSGDKAKVNNYIGTPIQADTQKVTNTTNQEIIYDKRGILVRQLLANSTDYADEQIKIINNGIWLTDDNWVTAKMGIGKYTFVDGSTKFGIISDVLCGNIVLSNNLYVTNTAGTVSIDKDGMTVTDMALTLTNSSATNRILLSGTDIIKVQKKVNNQWVNNLYIDENGNVKIAILSEYSTTEEMNSAINLSASNLTVTFNQLIETSLGDYSTTEEMNSAISVSASSLTSTFTTQINGVIQSVSEVEQTAENLSVSINNTKVTIDSTNGVTIKNGGIKILNNSNNSIFYVDSNGNLNITGYFSGNGITVDSNGTVVNNTFKIKNGSNNLLYVDSNGNLNITGYFSGNGITINSSGVTVNNTFKIKNGSNNLLYVDSSGNLNITGYYTGNGITMNENGLYVYNGKFKIRDSTGNFDYFTVNSDGNVYSRGLTVSSNGFTTPTKILEANPSDVNVKINKLKVYNTYVNSWTDANLKVSVDTSSIKIGNQSSSSSTGNYKLIYSPSSTGYYHNFLGSMSISGNIKLDGTVNITSNLNIGSMYKITSTYMELGNSSYFYKFSTSSSTYGYNHDFKGTMRIQTSLYLMGKTCSWGTVNGQTVLIGN